MWDHREQSTYQARNKSECKSGEGKYFLELSTDKKLCKIKGKPFHLHDVCSTLCFALGVTATHQFICIWAKRNLKHFHYLKRAISQLRSLLLLRAINLGQPPRCFSGLYFAESFHSVRPSDAEPRCLLLTRGVEGWLTATTELWDLIIRVIFTAIRFW